MFFEPLEERRVMTTEFLRFDGVIAPEAFSQQIALSTEHTDQGVHFEGLNGAGWEVLNQNSGFGIAGYSSPNFLAWNSDVTSSSESLSFGAPASQLSLQVGSTEGGSFTATAFDSRGNLLGSNTVALTSSMQTLALPFGNIASLQLSTTAAFGVVDNLQYDIDLTPPTPVTASFDNAGNLTISDSATNPGNNQLQLSSDGSNLIFSDPWIAFLSAPTPGSVLSNGGKTLSIPLSDVTGSITILGGAGDDFFTVDYAGGNPVPAGGISFDGGLGYDSLAVHGSGTQSANYVPGTTEGTNGKQGDIFVDDQLIHFDGLEPVDLTGVSASVTLAGADDLLTVANGVLFGNAAQAAILVSGTSGGVAIETAAFANLTAPLTINTTAVNGNDTITITSANGAPAGIASISIVTGTGADSVAINGAMNFTGSISIDTVNVTSTAAGTIATGTGLSITNTGVISALTGLISGAGGLTKSGTGSLVLGNTGNSFTGNVLVNGGGSVEIGNGGLGSGSKDVTLDNATLRETANYDPGDGTVHFVVAAGGATFDIATGARLNLNDGISGVLAQLRGPGALTKIGGGNLDLTGGSGVFDTFTGTITINAGQIQVAADNRLGAVPGAATPNAIVINGGSLQASGGFTLNANRGIGLGVNGGSGTGTIDVTSGNTLTYNGIVADVGTGADNLTKIGGGTLILGNGANTFTGNVLITGGGALQIPGTGSAQPNALGGAGANKTVTLDNGIFRPTGNYDPGADTVDFVINAGGGTFDVTGGTFNLNDDAGAAAQLRGVGNLVKTGAGTFSLAGGTGDFSNFSGTTTINAGVVIIDRDNGTGAGAQTRLGVIPGAATPAALVINGGTLQVTSTVTLAPNRGIALGAPAASAAGTIDVTGTNIFTYGGVLADNGTGADDLTKIGTGTLALTGAANSFSGVTNINAGTVQATSFNGLGPAGVSQGTTILAGGTLEYNGTFASPVTEPIIMNGALVSTGGDKTFSSTISILTGGAPTIANNTAATTLTVTTPTIALPISTNLIVGGAGNTSLASVISGPAGLPANGLNERWSTLTGIGRDENFVSAMGNGANGGPLAYNPLRGSNVLVGPLSNPDLASYNANATVTATANNVGPFFGTAGVGGGDDFAMTWTGLFTAPYSDTYTFNVGTSSGGVDDEMSVYIDKNDNGIFDAAERYGTTIGVGCCNNGTAGSVFLSAGETHRIAISFHEEAGGEKGSATFKTTAGTFVADTTINPSAANQAGLWSPIDSGLVKTGTGTVTLTAANTYAGPTNVNLGTLRVTDVNGLGASAGSLQGTKVDGGGTVEFSGTFGTPINEPIAFSGQGAGNAGAILSTGGNKTISGTLTPSGMAATVQNGTAGTTLQLTAATMSVPVYTDLQIGGVGDVSVATTISTDSTSVPTNALYQQLSLTPTSARNEAFIDGMTNNGGPFTQQPTRVTNFLQGGINYNTAGFNAAATVLPTANNVGPITGNTSGGLADDFLFLWTGRFNAPYADTYTFRAGSLSGGVDDEVSIYIDKNDNRIFEASERYATTVGVGCCGVGTSVPVAFTAGESHIVAIAFHEWAGGEVGSASFSTTGGAFTADTAINPAAQPGVWTSNYGAVTKIGSGTTTLSIANTYTVPTAVNAGTLKITNPNALGGTAALQGTTVVSGATLEFNGTFATPVNESISFTGTGVAGVGALLSTGGNKSIAGTLSPTNTLVSVQNSTAGTTLQLTAPTLNILSNTEFQVGGVGDVTVTSAVSSSANPDIPANGLAEKWFALSGVPRDENYINSMTNNGGPFTTTPVRGSNYLVGPLNYNALAQFNSAATTTATANNVGPFTGTAGVGGGDDFAFLWTGRFNAPYADTYTFRVGSLSGGVDDEMSIYIDKNDNRIFEASERYATTVGIGCCAAGSSVPVAFAAGESHLVAIAFHEEAGGETASASFSTTGGTFTADTAINPTAAAQVGMWTTNVGALIKTGSGTATLGTAGTYSLPTLVNTGTLKVADPGALGSLAQPTAVAIGATLDFSGTFASPVNETISFSGTGVGGIGAVVSSGGNKTIASNLLATGLTASLQNITAGTTLQLTAPALNLPSNFNFQIGGAGDINVTSVIDNGSPANGLFQRWLNLTGVARDENFINNMTNNGGPFTAPVRGSNFLVGPLSYNNLAAFNAAATLTATANNVGAFSGTAGVGGGDDFGFLWTGTFKAPYADTYTFRVGSLSGGVDDEMSLYVDKNDNGIFEAGERYATTSGVGCCAAGTSVPVAFTAGESHLVAIAFHEEAGGETASASFSTTGGTFTADTAINPSAPAQNGMWTTSTFTKNGTGNTTLTAANTYGALNFVTGGTLLANNSTGSAVGAGNIAVSGGTFGGTGSVTGSITVTGSGRLAPGTVTESLASGAISLVAGTSFDVDINGTNAGAAVNGYDQQIVTGTVSLSGAALTVTSGFTAAFGATFTIIDNDLADAVIGTFAGKPEGAVFTAGANTFQITYLGGSNGNDVVLTAIDPLNPILMGTNNDDTFSAVKNGAGVDISLNGNLIYTVATATTPIVIQGLAGDDTLNVNYGSGVVGPINFVGGEGNEDGVGDVLNVSGGTFTSLVYAATGDGTGTLTFAGAAAVITFSQLEPVTVTSTLGSVQIDIDQPNNIAGPNTAVISDAAGANMTVTLNLPFESITFSNPTTALIINGDNVDNDTITVASVDTAFRAPLTINGQGGTDSVNLNAALSLGSGATTGSLAVTAETINVGASVATDFGTNAGSITFTGPVNLTGNATLDTDSALGTDGSVSFSSTVRSPHTYQLVTTPLTWAAARTAALASVSGGLNGYLATITTAGENNLVRALAASGSAWIGATDNVPPSSAEGNWIWADGPEAGQQFWSGAVAGTTTAPFFFAAWNANEPNNSGGENFAEIGFPAGGWNDLGAAATRNYVVEYGNLSSLTIASGTGSATFAAAIGDNSSPLNSLSVTAASINLNGTPVNTINDQTFTGAVSLGSNLTQSGLNITFNGSVNSSGGARSLTATASGSFSAANGVGTGSPLSTISVTGSTAYSSAIVLGNVTTTGTQTYTAPDIFLSGTLSTQSAAVNINGDLGLLGPAGITTTASGAGAPVTVTGATNNAHYYRFVNTLSTWSAAQTAANGTAAPFAGLSSGYLATPRSAYENFKIKGVAVNNDILIGGTDQTTEGNWLWANAADNNILFWQGAAAGTAQNGQYTNWNGGEPNDSGANEDFAVMLGGSGLWNDVGGTTFRYVVEFSATAAQSFTVTAGTGAVLLQNAVGNLDRPASVSLSGSTVNIANVQTVGAQTYTGTTTARGTTYSSAGGAISFNGNVNLSAAANIATTDNAAPGANITFTGTVNATSATSYQVVNNGASLSWTAARALATTAGGWLVNITTAGENTTVQGLPGINNAWIGATDNAALTMADGRWVWSDGPEAGQQFWQGLAAGNTTAPFNFANWNGGEPNGGTAEDYGQIISGGAANGKWNDLANGGGPINFYIVEWVANPNLTLTAGTGAIGATGAVGATNALGNITVNTASNVTFGSTIRATGNVSQLAGTGTTTFNGTSGTGIGGTLSVTTSSVIFNSAPVVTVGNVTVSAVDSITLNAAAGINAGASLISLSANNNGDASGAFTQATGTLIQTTSNAANAVAITVNTATGTGAMAVAGVQSGASGAVTLNANLGAITDTNAAGLNVSADRLVATAALGIDLDTAINQITASSVNTAILIRETNGLAVNTVTAGTGTVTLTLAAGAITDNNTSGMNVTGGALLATAVTGIDLDTTVSTATISNSGAGNVLLDNTGALNLLGLTVANGTLTLTSTGALTDGLTATTSVSGNANISAPSITLGEAAGDSVNFGSLTFVATGAVVISENSSLTLTGVNSAASVDLDSTGSISDATATSVVITGLADVNGITSISLGGGTFNAGTVTFNSTGAVVISEDSSLDIVGTNTGASTDLDALGSISDAGASSVVVTGLVDANGTAISLGAGIFNSGTLTFVSTSTVNITEDSSLDLVGTNSATGAVTLTTIDTLAGTENISVPGGVSLSGSSLTLNSGDNVTVAGTLTATTTTIAINVDFNSADPALGGIATLTGSTITTPAGVLGGTFLTGNLQADSFILNPQTTTEFFVVGNDPTTAIGDTLKMTVTGLGATLSAPGSVYSGNGSGDWTFGAGQRDVHFGTIETLDITGQYHLAYNNDVTRAGTLVVLLTATGDLEIHSGSAAGPTLLGPISGSILSLTVNGNTQSVPETVIVDDVRGLPLFASSPVGSPNNLNVPGTIGLLFNGNGGTNTLSFNLTQASTAQVLGLGDGVTGVGADGNAEVQTTSGAQSLGVYGTSLASITRTATGATPGSLTIIAEGGNDDIDVTANGVSTDITAANYASFNFSAINTYGSVTILAGDGQDNVQLNSLGGGTSNVIPFTLDGGNADDVLGIGNVLATLGAQVTVAGGAGSDVLNVDNSGSATAQTNVIVREDSIDNVTGRNATGDVLYGAVETLNVLTSTGNDTIRANFDNSPGGTVITATINGSGGNDQFFLDAATTPALDFLNLQGGAGNDTFGTAPSGPTGAPVQGNEIVPVTGVQIVISGESSSAIAGTNPSAETDQLNLNISSFATAEVIDSVTGQVISIGALPSHSPLYFNGVEDLNVFDGNVLTNTAVGDLYLRSTNDSTSDNILFYRGGNGLGDVTIMMNDRIVNRLPFRPTSRIVAYGRGGNDAIQLNFTAGTVSAEFHGEDGQDDLLGSFQGDLLVGGAQADHLIGMDGNDVLWGDQEALTWATRSGDGSVGSTDGNDTLEGTAGDDFIFGGGGNDRLLGLAGNDYLHGGFGNDSLVGAEGNDLLRAGDGNDEMVGDDGNDITLAGTGDDFIYGSFGRDFQLGGDGSDRIYDLNDEGEDVNVTETNSYDIDLTNPAYDPNNPLTFFGPNDVALLNLMLTWSDIVPSFGTRAAAAKSLLFGQTTNDSDTDFMFGNLLAPDYSIMVTGDLYDYSAGDMLDPV